MMIIHLPIMYIHPSIYPILDRWDSEAFRWLWVGASVRSTYSYECLIWWTESEGELWGRCVCYKGCCYDYIFGWGWLSSSLLSPFKSIITIIMTIIITINIMTIKVVLGAGLWNLPHIVILDEPTNFLDRDSLGALATAIKGDCSSLLVYHLW